MAKKIHEFMRKLTPEDEERLRQEEMDVLRGKIKEKSHSCRWLRVCTRVIPDLGTFKQYCLGDFRSCLTFHANELIHDNKRLIGVQGRFPWEWDHIRELGLGYKRSTRKKRWVLPVGTLEGRMTGIILRTEKETHWLNMLLLPVLNSNRRVRIIVEEKL